MKNKLGDIPYFGVDPKKIALAAPKLEEFALANLTKWVLERYKIHIKKDVLGLPPPWTNWDPLVKFRFTNVRRELDRETKFLLKNIVNNPSLSYEDKLMNCVLFRTWNRGDTFSHLGGPWTIAQLMTPFFVRNHIPTYDAMSGVQDGFFTKAFFTSGLIRARRWENSDKELADRSALLMFTLAQDFVNLSLKGVLEAANPQMVIDSINLIKGISYFLSYQMFVDFSYISEFPFSENEFTIAGPGCKKGIDWLFTDRDGLSYEECLFWLRDNQLQLMSRFGYIPSILFEDLPEEDRRLNVMSLENCMCELSKLMRYLSCKGRPKLSYTISAYDSNKLF